MSDEEDNLSSSESVTGEEESEYEVNSDDDDMQGNGNGASHHEEVIDDATLFRSFKILRTMLNTIDEHLQSRVAQNSSAGPSNRNRTAVASKASSRCHLRYFKQVIDSLDDQRKNVIVNFGFPSLLEFDGSTVPRTFVQWIADKVDVNCGDIIVAGKSIPLNPLAVHKVKSIEETCYAPSSADDQYESFKQYLSLRFGYLPNEVTEQLSSIFKTFSDNDFAAPDYSPDQLVLSMFQFMHESSASIPEHQNSDDGTDVAASHDENFDDHTGDVATGNGIAEDYDAHNDFNDVPADGNDVEMPANNVPYNEEAPVEDLTQRVESDGNNAVCSQDNAGSQATVVLPSDNSVSKGAESTSPGKRKRKSRQSVSPAASNSVASRTRRRLAELKGRSPLSVCNNSNEENTSSGTMENPLEIDCDDVAVGAAIEENAVNDVPENNHVNVGTENNPVDVESLPVEPPKRHTVQISIMQALENCARKHEEYARNKNLRLTAAPAVNAPKDGNASDKVQDLPAPNQPEGQQAPAATDDFRPVPLEVIEDKAGAEQSRCDPNLRRPVGYSVPDGIPNPMENQQFGHLLRRTRAKVISKRKIANSTGLASQPECTEVQGGSVSGSVPACHRESSDVQGAFVSGSLPRSQRDYAQVHREYTDVQGASVSGSLPDSGAFNVSGVDSAELQRILKSWEPLPDSWEDLNNQ
ncbi:hypothetical protein EJB05_57485, partial [Eragrostis curvula]